MEAVSILDPHTAADPVAILAQSLVVFGSVAGPYYLAESDRHHGNLSVNLVGGLLPGICRSHLRAALGLWAFAEASAGSSSGMPLGDPPADDLLRILRQAGEGMHREALRMAFGRHRRSAEIGLGALGHPL